jgi:hypothetical protein
MGERDALHAHRRPLGRGGGLPDGPDPADRPDPATALEAGIALARKAAACGPLGIKTTLESAHLAIDKSQTAAFARLNEQFGGLFRTEDFTEGRKAEAEGRPPSTTASRQARAPGPRGGLALQQPCPMSPACTSLTLAQAWLAVAPGRSGEPIPDGGPRMLGCPSSLGAPSVEPGTVPVPAPGHCLVRALVRAGDGAYQDRSGGLDPGR